MRTSSNPSPPLLEPCRNGENMYIVQQIMHAHGGTVELLQSKGRITLRTIWPRARSRF